MWTTSTIKKLKTTFKREDKKYDDFSKKIYKKQSHGKKTCVNINVLKFFDYSLFAKPFNAPGGLDAWLELCKMLPVQRIKTKHDHNS